MGQTCGILPVGVNQAQVLTRHLKWNLGEQSGKTGAHPLEDWVTSFDGEVSSSNHLLPSEPVVYVKTDNPVLWCIEVKADVRFCPNGRNTTDKTRARRVSFKEPFEETIGLV
jgi:thiamine pyrophosphokinase